MTRGRGACSISAPQTRMLLGLFRGFGWQDHVRGSAAKGGAWSTREALIRRGLMTGDNDLTELGRETVLLLRGGR